MKRVHLLPHRIAALAGASWVPLLLLAVLAAGCQPREERAGTEIDARVTEPDDETGETAGEATATAEAEDETLGEQVEEIGERVGEIEGGIETAGRSLEDAAITAQVKADLTAEPDLDASRIDVDTDEGVVTLSGTVDSESERARAEEIARGIRDVEQVVNRLEVIPS